MHNLNPLSNPISRLKLKCELAHSDKVKQAKNVLTALQVLLFFVMNLVCAVVYATEFKEFNFAILFVTLVIIGKLQSMKGDL